MQMCKYAHPHICTSFINSIPVLIIILKSMTRTGHVIAGVCMCALLVANGRRTIAQTRSSVDTILTTRGAATLISCDAAVSTFQIGDGKNADYDYRIVDGNLVFIRPTAPMPRTTNLIVREGGNIHYLILA